MREFQSHNTRDFFLFSKTHIEVVKRLLNTIGTSKDRTQLSKNPFKLELNPESSTVFLLDENYTSAVMRGEFLDYGVVCGCLYEGFSEDLFARGGCCRKLSVEKTARLGIAKVV